MTGFFTRKRLIVGGAVLVFLVAVGIGIAKRNQGADNVLTDTVKQQTIKQTVLATGQVTSTTDLNLSFKGSGVVAKVNAKVGQQVKNGDVLATLNQRDQAASLTTARGALAQAQANYNKVIAGASGPDIDIAKSAVASAQTSLDNAKAVYSATKAQQDVLVRNALSALLNSGIALTPVATSGTTATVSASGSYNGTQPGTYIIKTYYSSQGVNYSVSGLESDNVLINRGIPGLVGSKGLYITFSTSGDIASGNEWTIELPNTQSPSYTANNNAYQAALQARDQALLNAQNAINTAQSGLDQANASLALKQAAARPEDVAAARAQILSASGQVQAASAAIENGLVRAPADGTITSIDIKVGEQATPGKAAIVLQDVNNLHVEANISEANIANVKPGQEVEFTFDALGSDRKFKGTVATIDPASTVVSGVVNYKVTASLEKLEEIKPGMTANMTVLVATKENVLAVPTRAVLSHDNKKFVRVVDDQKKKTYHEVEVETGMEADGGIVEITSGLSAGQQIVTFINKK